MLQALKRILGFQVTKEIDLERLRDHNPYITSMTPESAMQIPALWRALSIKADDVAGTPFRVLKTVGEDDRVRAIEHPAYGLIRTQASQSQTAYDFKHHMQLMADLHGNAYARVWRDGAYNPIDFEPLPPWPHTYPVIEGTGPHRRKVIVTDHYSAGGSSQKALAAADVIHIKGLSSDGVTGISAIEALSISLSGGVAVQRYAHLYFKQGGNVKGYLKVPAKLTPEQQDDIRKNWQSITEGLENSHRIGVLHGGTEYLPVSQNAAESQLVDARNATITDIANMTGVRPHDLGSQEGVSYNGIEAENQSHIRRAIGPCFDKWESQLDATCLTKAQRDKRTHRCRFDRDYLIHVGVGEQANADAKYVAAHIKRPNDIRKRMNLPRIDGGDEFPEPKGSNNADDSESETRRKNGRADSDR